MTSPLVTPFTLGRMTLANRFVRPAMRRGMGEDGAPSSARIAQGAGADRAEVHAAHRA